MPLFCNIQNSSSSTNPLGMRHGSCPSEDWRNPPNIDMYSQVTRKVAKEFNMPFLDTNFIIGTLWDSGKDWCHYNDFVIDVEKVYILDRMLSYP